MRRVTLMVAAMAVMVSLFAAAAYAATIYGTSEGDVLLESQRDDTIHGRQAGDEIFASLFGPEGELEDTDADRDRVFGNRGPDYIDVTDGDEQDTAIGGRGYDECWGDSLGELDCEKENGRESPIN